MFLDSGRAQIAYETGGSATAGREVLLIHAGVADRRSWAALTARLESDCRWASYDARGYGETTYEPEPHRAHDDALAVLDAVAMQSPVVVGSSVGGRTALDLALTHPDRVSRVVLIGPAVSGAPDFVDDPESVLVLAEALEAAEERGDLGEVNRLEAHLWLDGPDAPEGRVTGPPRELFLEMNRLALAADDPGDPPDSVDAWGRLEELRQPVLLLVGDLDLLDFHRNCQEIARRAPHARLVVLEGVAHLPQLEADARCLDEIAAFVRG